jgi:hypothetical protein
MPTERTECSKPRATKTKTDMMQAMALEARSAAPMPIHTPELFKGR